ncbi:unnamed protein product [Ceutorhynchus assimilis]|uniref:Uncharacterized protein n=1 Tax=Ceutorhynchus assimilis TaxID=467358 RepID=A0A9P0DMU0_9CUCU|nr:unnamed protein product [Ceutorhynchus assimilis]
MNKDKAPKSERSRRPHPLNANRVPHPRPPPQSAPQQPPTSSGSIFGSLRRLKVTSTPKKTELDKKPDKAKTKKNNDLVEEESTTKNIDNNGNNVATVLSSTTVDRVEARKKTRDNVKSVVEIHRRPAEFRRAAPPVPSGLRKDKTKSSTVSLQNLLRTPAKATQNQGLKPKRPITVAIPSNVTIRRGHKEGQAHPDNISRTSSITNLDSLESNLSSGKGAKPRKVSSKERIDKQGQDGKKVTKNNNKLEPPQPVGPPLSYSSDSLQETELQQLKKQLRDMADEKSSLALQLGEHRGQLNVLQKEISKLKSFQDESNLEMGKLSEENTLLRNRLRDVVHSPLSDNEKQQLLFETRHHSSAPASIATNAMDDHGGDTTACTTPDWDKHSSGNLSEVSVACLQDKINQMQETHYSTNEELQATLQELTDLQRQLTELQQENERLNEEKTLMFDSLCRQTERLNDSRQEVENLKQLLYRDRSDETGINQLESAAEREQKLVELLRSAQEEREQLLLKLEQIQGDLHESRTDNIDKTETISQQNERVRTLECTLDAKHAEHNQLDQELAQAKDQCSGRQIEINRLSDLLENARTKIIELEQDRALGDKSELDELLDNARKEKDQLESEVAYLKEQLARSKNEIEKLKEQVFVLQEECKVTRNNAKTTQADLEYKSEKLSSEKSALADQLQQFQEAVNELQVQAQCHLEDKRQLSTVLSETQRNMSEAERKNLNLENELQELKKLRAEENDEWEKFQNDLLTSVRVANDFKTEAQQELQKIILENKTYREKVRLLEGQVEKLKGEKVSTTTQTDIILTPQIISLARNVDLSLHNRFSLQEHLTTPTENMDKLFPILSRRSKSKENIADTSIYKSSERSSNKKLKSGDNSLERRQKSSLKKSKSKDSLEQLAIESTSQLKPTKSEENLTEIDSKSKGNRGFLNWNKSKDNLEQYGAEPSNTPKEKKSFFKRNKSQESLDKIVDLPRKSIESSDSNKSEPKQTEFFGKFIKKREKKPPNRSHVKFMSVEEEMLLKSLGNWYDNIDENIPDELLSEEDRAVRKLKILFENESLKEKPMAHKPKEHLAISKPLLNSVVLNPKLEQICRDPKLIIVDSEVRQSALEEPHKSEEVYTNIGPPGGGIYKSKSLDDINVFEEYRTESEMAPVLYRPVVTNNLTIEEHSSIKYNQRSSDIQPNDSASNPRYSAKYYNLPKPNIYINYENLDEIVDKIPRNVSQNKLTEEQKFALKLKEALDEAEKKTTLKKITKGSIRGMDISTPTRESVERNWKLKEILLNPGIKKAEEWKRHSTDISSDLGSPRARHKSIDLQKTNMSKSHEDISFSFVPENTLLNMYFGEKVQESKFNSDDTSSSSQSFTSGTFNLDTGNIEQKCDILEVPKSSKRDFEEDLLYNDTLNKTKEAKEKRLSKDEHPKIKEAKNNYKTEVQLMLKQIDTDKLRSSLRKQRLDADDLQKKSEAYKLVLEKPVNNFIKHEQEFAGKNDVEAKSFEVEDRRSLTVDQTFHVEETNNVSSFDIQFKGPASDQAHSVQKNIKYQTPNRDSTSSSLAEPKTREQNEIQPIQKLDFEHDVVYQISTTTEYSTSSVNIAQITGSNIIVAEKNKPQHVQKLIHENTASIENDQIVETDTTEQNVPQYSTSSVDAAEITESNSIMEKLEKNELQQLIHENVFYQKPNRYSISSVDNAQITEPEIIEQNETQSIQKQDSENVDFVETTKPLEATKNVEKNVDDPTENLQEVADISTSNVTEDDALYTEHSESSMQEVDAPIPQDYGYKQILKENQYGVVSPLDLRYTYRTVVKEYKGKYPPEDKTSDDSESLDDFIDEYFDPIEALDSEEGPVIEEIPGDDVTIRKPDSMSQIDKEMHDIMDKYLHTRASLLVKKINNNDTSEQKSNLKKYQNFEDLQAIERRNEPEPLSAKDLQFIEEMKAKYTNDHYIASPAIVIEEEQSEVKSTHSVEDIEESESIQDHDNNARLSLEDLQFIEEMKAKYASTETISTSPDKHLEESISNLRPPKTSKSQRPLSEINAEDLKFIEEITRRTMSDDTGSTHENSMLIEELRNESVPPLPASPIPSEIVAYESRTLVDSVTSTALLTSEREAHLPPSLRPKKPTQLPLPQTSYSNIDLRNKQQRLSYQETPSSSKANSNKRLSDLMFKETIFVPLSQNPDYPKSPKYKQDNSYKEKLFVASPESTLASKIPTLKKETKESPNKQNVEIKLNKYSSTSQSRSSWSNSLKKGLLDTSPTSYEPVYSNVHYKPAAKTFYKATIVKKPLPLPRESSFRNVKSEVSEVDISGNMSESDQNFSKEEPIISQDAIKIEGKRAHTDISKKIEELKAENVMSEPSIVPAASILASASENEENEISQSKEGKAAIESHSSYDSYLDLFKTKESEDFDNLRGKNPRVKYPARGNFHLEDIIADEDDDDEEEAAVRPKIVDFVPLDDETITAFTKEPNSSYDTLEREKTFQVLEEAALKGDNKEAKTEDSVEVIVQKSSTTISKSSSKSHTSSRASFTQAKKLFEALAEANKEEKPNISNPFSRTNVRESRGLEEIKGSSSQDGEGEASNKQ